MATTVAQPSQDPAINELKLNINGIDITIDNDLIKNILASGDNLSGDSIQQMHEKLKTVNLKDELTINIKTYKLKGPVEREVTQLEHDKLIKFNKDLDDVANISTILHMEQEAAKERKAEEQTNAATKIQAAHRGNVGRQAAAAAAEEERKAEEARQAAIKAEEERKELDKQNDAAKTIQASVRQQQARKELDKQNTAATKIQALQRGKAARRMVEEMKEMVREAEDAKKEAINSVNAAQDAVKAATAAADIAAAGAANAKAVLEQKTAEARLKVAKKTNDIATSFLTITKRAANTINNYSENSEEATKRREKAKNVAEKAAANWKAAMKATLNKTEKLKDVSETLIGLNKKQKKLEGETESEEAVLSSDSATKPVIVDNPLARGREHVDESSSSDSGSDSDSDSVLEQQQAMAEADRGRAAQKESEMRAQHGEQNMTTTELLPKSRKEREVKLKQMKERGAIAKEAVEKVKQGLPHQGPGADGKKTLPVTAQALQGVMTGSTIKGGRKKTKKKRGGGKKRKTRK